MSIEDPRHYLAIKPVPPWEVAKDAKLKARSFDQYNLGSPTRLDMFRMNYSRRLRQMNSQGFMSSQSKPYQPVGTLVLNVKDLVKKTLGQDKAGDDQVTPAGKSSNLEYNMQSNRSSSATRHGDVRRRPASAVESVSSARRRKQKMQHLQDIATNLNVVENTKCSVKMGHSLFEVLETMKTQNAKTQNEIQLQPPELPTAVGEQKENIPEENMSMNLMNQETEIQDGSQDGVHTLPVPKSLFNLTSTYSDDDNENISKFYHDDAHQVEVNETHAAGELPESHWLWRQLCALHWLIEACKHEQSQDLRGQRMIPIAECWNVVRPGGHKISTINPDRYAAVRWRQFSTSSFQTSVPASRSTSACSETTINRLMTPTSPRRMRDIFPIFRRSRSPSPSIVSTIAETPRTNTNDIVPHSSKDSQTSDDPAEYHKNLLKLLDTVKESVNKELLFREKVAEEEAESRGKLCTPIYKWAYAPYTRKPPQEKKKNIVNENEQTKFSDPNQTKKNVVKIRPHTAHPTMRQNRTSETPKSEQHRQSMSSLQLTSRAHMKRPRSSPPKLSLHFNTQFQSSAREQTMIKMREQFEEVTNLKAIRLHHSFTELQRSRWERMEKKFEAFHVKQRGMHKDLKVMRSAATIDKTSERSASRLASPATAALSCEWYSKLLSMTAVNTCDEKLCITILKRLEESAAQFMGWQAPENAFYTKRSKSIAPIDNQITVESFVSVLRQLRSFEMHSPDVSAAVEFMRENIVKMSKEQFDDVISKQQ